MIASASMRSTLLAESEVIVRYSNHPSFPRKRESRLPSGKVSTCGKSVWIPARASLGRNDDGGISWISQSSTVEHRLCILVVIGLSFHSHTNEDEDYNNLKAEVI